MFGGSFGGFGQQQQQQQQQPQQPGLFGGTGFGAPPAFGTPAPAFGQPAPQASGFGGFGAPAGNTAFGAAPPTTPSFGGGGGLFGGAAPASTGFSFGGTANTGFGAPTTSAAPASGGLFGAKPAGSTFGGGGFGAPAAGGLFGSGAGSTFGASAVPTAGQGTLNPPFQTTSEKDVGSTTTSVHQSISCMPAYKNYSFEELRLQDYQANRKFPQATTSFGGGSGFGSAAPAFGAAAPTSNIFGGASSSFGTPAPAAGGFGAPAPSIFGSGGGAFGQPAAPASNMFGAAAPAAGGFGGGFGAAPAAPAFGAPASGGLFGAPKPAASFSFGAPAPAQPTAGLFGQQPQQNAFGAQPPAAGGMFGQPAQPAGGLFGQPAQPPAAGGFSFGAPAQPAAGLFGSAPAATAFGASPAAAKPAFSFGQPAAGGGLFGAAPAQPLGGFGAPAAPAQPSLFGGAGGGFGQPATNSFGAGGLFGAKPPTPAGSLFGSVTAAPQLGGLFGAQPPAQQPSLFGGLGNSFGGGLSTASQQQQPPRQQLYASVDENAYGSNPLFASMGAPAPVVNLLDNKKKPPLSSAFRSTPRSSTKIARLRGFGASTASPGLSGTGGASPSSFAASIGAGGTPGSGRGSPLHLLNGMGDETVLSPNTFLSRPSVKKLVIERRATPEDLSRSRTPTSAALVPKAKEGLDRPRVTFNAEPAQPSTSTAQREPDLFGSSTPVKKVAPPPAPVVEEKVSVVAKPASAPVEKAARRSPVVEAPVHGEYYTTPSIDELRKLPAAALQAVSDLVVGRVGYGEVRFDAPVDLTTLNSVEDLCGQIVVFEDRNCTVYPPEYEDKPPAGQGLNVPATITLLRCFPLNKSTREPITDRDHPKLISHIKRLRSLEGTEFIEFVVDSGSWKFGVAGF